MRIFDRYMLSQLLKLFGFFALVFVAIYWVNRTISLFDTLIAGGQSSLVFLEFTTLTLPTVVINVMPVAAFVATIYGINRLHQDSELIVAQTSGLSPWRMARPVLMFSLIIFLIMSLISHVLQPMTRSILADKSAMIARDLSAKFLKEGEFIHPGRGVTVFVREISENGELLGLLLEDRRATDAVTYYTAEKALLVETEAAPRLIMFAGMAQTLRLQSQNLLTVTFSDFTYNLEALVPDGQRKKSLRELSTRALFQAGEEAESIENSQFLYRAHLRFADPLYAATLPLFVLGGLLLGRYSRFGLWRQILGVVLLALTIQTIGNATKSIALQSAHSWPLLYISPLLSAALGSAGLIWASLEGRRPKSAVMAR